jgi:hypothetical protein
MKTVVAERLGQNPDEADYLEITQNFAAATTK